YPDTIVRHPADLSGLSEILWGNADGSFTADTGPKIFPSAVADFDGDGRADIFTGVQVLYGQPARRVAAVDVPVGASPGAAGDVDGDGTADLVLTQHHSGADGTYDIVPIYLSEAKHAIVSAPTFQFQVAPGMFPPSF